MALTVSNKKNYIFRTLVLFLLLIYFTGSISSSSNFKKRLAEEAQLYDDSTKQVQVLRHSQLDSQLNTLTAIEFYNLPNVYLKYSESHDFENTLKYKKYFQVEGVNIYKFIVGHFRLGDFMSKTHFIKAICNV